MLINDLNYFKNSANYSSKTSGMDHPDKSGCTSKDWHAYPIQNFDYQFNSWGFRAPEYENLIGKPVNICLGDSFTVNVGGPIEHSWQHQLQQNFDIPTINLGMDGAGNDTIRIVYERACDVFDVKNTFVMYSYLHRRIEYKQGVYYRGEHIPDDVLNFEYFKQQRLDNVYESVIPYWCHSDAELEYFKQQGLTFFGSEKDRPTFIDKQRYTFVAGPDWPTYDEYIAGADFDEAKDFYLEVNIRVFQNRDGHHMDKLTNSWYADYYYNQWKQQNES